MATFELVAHRDTLGTLADLVVDFCHDTSVDVGVSTAGERVFIFDETKECRSFEEKKLSELKLGIGDVFSFKHGDNIHDLALTDAVLGAFDKSSDRLPVMIFMKSDLLKLRTAKCDICDAFSARTAVFHDPRAPENPTLFCDQCLHMFHYTADGVLHPDSERLSQLPENGLRFYPLY